MEDEQAAKRARNSVDEEDVLDLIGGGEELGEEERDDNEDVQNAEDDEALEDELRVRQIEIDNCQAEMLEKLREIEAHYEILKKPLYKARGEVISRIPGFWLHCFMQHDRIRHVLGRVDQDILASLTKLEIEQFEEVNTGYAIRLHFAPNDFFEDEILEKEMRFLFEEGQPVICSVTGCNPTWKGEDPLDGDTINKGRKRGRDSVTFMRWFTHEKTFEPGLVDTLADIIKDQIYLNPIIYMDAESHEGHGQEGALNGELLNEETEDAPEQAGNSDWDEEEEEEEDLVDELEDDGLNEELRDEDPSTLEGLEDDLPDYEEGEEEDEGIDLEPDEEGLGTENEIAGLHEEEKPRQDFEEEDQLGEEALEGEANFEQDLEDTLDGDVPVNEPDLENPPENDREEIENQDTDGINTGFQTAKEVRNVGQENGSEVTLPSAKGAFGSLIVGNDGNGQKTAVSLTASTTQAMNI